MHFKKATSARSKLPQDKISSFYGLYPLTMVHMVSDLLNSCQVASHIVHQSMSHTIEGESLTDQLLKEHKSVSKHTKIYLPVKWI